jgi:hypothetical protein
MVIYNRKEKNMDLEFTRGDTQVIKFQIKDGYDNPIIPTLSDNVYFTVKQNSNSKKVLIKKEFPENGINYEDGYFYFTLESDDTSNLAYGTYQYDIEFKSEKYVKTLGFGSITLTDEITFKEDE